MYLRPALFTIEFVSMFQARNINSSELTAIKVIKLEPGKRDHTQG